MLGPLIGLTGHVLEGRGGSDAHHTAIPRLALEHFTRCLDAAGYANEKGSHSVAMCLLRQCVEAFTILEVGLQKADFRDRILPRWEEKKISHGDIRHELERHAWQHYGPGLWGESWSNFFGNLARAVQPYAHYSPDLMGWQWAVLQTPGKDARFAVMTGSGAYDALKASRITLLQILLGWALGRILLSTNQDRRDVQGFQRPIIELGQALARSKLLLGRKNWSEELWPHWFFKDGVECRDD